MCFLIKEGKYPEPEPIDPQATLTRRFTGATRLYFKECYANPYYLLVFSFVMLAVLSFAPINTYCIFYAQQRNVSLDLYGKCIGASFVVSLILSYFLGVLADKFHPLRCGIVSLMLYSLTSLISSFCITNVPIFCAAIIVSVVVAGCYQTLTASLLLRLLPRDRFAQFASASHIFSAVCSIGFVPVIGFLLDLLHNDYDYLYLFGGLLSGTASVIGILLCIQINRHCGGLEHYQAP